MNWVHISLANPASPRARSTLISIDPSPGRPPHCPQDPKTHGLSPGLTTNDRHAHITNDDTPVGNHRVPAWLLKPEPGFRHSGYGRPTPWLRGFSHHPSGFKRQPSRQNTAMTTKPALRPSPTYLHSSRTFSRRPPEYTQTHLNPCTKLSVLPLPTGVRRRAVGF